MSYFYDEVPEEELAKMPERVARGVAWAKEQGLLDFCDMNKLDMDSACGCVIGQHYGNFYRGNGMLNLTTEQCIDMGILAPEDRFKNKYSKASTAEWRRQVAELYATKL